MGGISELLSLPSNVLCHGCFLIGFEKTAVLQYGADSAVLGANLTGRDAVNNIQGRYGVETVNSQLLIKNKEYR